MSQDRTPGNSAETAPAMEGGRQPGRRRYLVFALLAVSLLSFTMQFAMVTVSLPQLMEDLGAPIRWGGWVLTIFLVGQVVAMPTAGRLAERFGASRVFALGFLLFASASFVAAISPSIYILIGARAVQGLAGGTLQPSGIAVIAEEFQEQRQRAIGLYGSIMPFGAVAGPVVGGIIADQLGWRWTFAYHVPLGLLVCIAAFTILPGGVTAAVRRRMDLLGVILLGGAMTTLIFGLTELGRREVTPNYALAFGSIVVALAIGALLVRHERRVETPMVDLDLLSQRAFVVANSLAFSFGFFWLGSFSLLALFLQAEYGMTASESGLLLAPRSAVMGLVSASAAMLIFRTGYRLPIITSMVGMGITLGVISLRLHDPSFLGLQISSFWWMTILAVLGGGLFGLAAPSLQNAALDLAPDRLTSVAGLRGFFQSVGGVVGVATTVLASSMAPTIAEGMAIAFAIYAFVMLLVPWIVVALPRGPGATSPGRPGGAAAPAAPEEPARHAR